MVRLRTSPGRLKTAYEQTYLVKLAPHDVHVWRYCPQIIIRFLVADVAGAYYLTDLSWYLPVSDGPTKLSPLRERKSALSKADPPITA